MGWYVLGFVNIDFNCKVTNQLIEGIKKILDKNGEYYSDFSGEGKNISFKLEGNKYIDNDCLDKIKRKFKKYILEINCNEFVETGEGYYYSSED